MIETLSGGNQQKVIISRLLAAKPRVLLLNDPTRGVDLGAKRDLYVLLADLVGSGMAVVMLSSEVDEHVELMDRVLVFREHEVFCQLDRARARSPAAHRRLLRRLRCPTACVGSSAADFRVRAHPGRRAAHRRSDRAAVVLRSRECGAGACDARPVRHSGDGQHAGDPGRGAEGWTYPSVPSPPSSIASSSHGCFRTGSVAQCLIPIVPRHRRGGIGAVNGLLVAVLRYQPVIATLCVFFILAGLADKIAPKPTPASANWTVHLGGEVGPIPWGAAHHRLSAPGVGTAALDRVSPCS